MQITVPKYTESDIIVQLARIEQLQGKVEKAQGVERLQLLTQLKTRYSLYNSTTGRPDFDVDYIHPAKK